MGKKSKVPDLRRRIILARQARYRRIMKTGPWTCPWCHNLSLTARYEGSRKFQNKLVLFGCAACRQGEMLPRHPTLEIADLYHMVLDTTRNGKAPPVFKYKRMTAGLKEFLEKNISFGSIKVLEVIE